jgi:ribonuclease P/MRP protein subunit POP5
MKLKILPPTLRINNRYLVLDIKSEIKISKDELVSAIWYACLRLYGEIGTSDFNLWLMKFYDISNYSSKHYKIDNNINNNKVNIYNNNNNNNNFTNYEEEPSYYHFKVVLRCKRGCEDKVRGSLALLSNYNNSKIAITTIGISGTISSSIEKFIN